MFRTEELVSQEFLTVERQVHASLLRFGAAMIEAILVGKRIKTSSNKVSTAHANKKSTELTRVQSVVLH